MVRLDWRNYRFLAAFRMTFDGRSELNFGEEVEEGVDALAELGLDLFAGAFEQMHGDVGGVSVLEFDGGFADGRDFIGG